jgi:8-oxo-dGTP pyrophosphatase MutT (NUDIX family)
MSPERLLHSCMPHLPQAGAIPFRHDGARVEFLLVTSHRGNWIFPKGVVELGDSPEDTARREAEEEAGILGSVLPGPVGCYDDQKDWNPSRVLMFLLHYEGDLGRWRESGRRAKRWCSFDDAMRLLKKGDLRDILKSAHERLARLGGAETIPDPTSKGV